MKHLDQEKSMMLPYILSTYINSLVEAGEYSSINAVIVAALRVFQERETVIENWLKMDVIPVYDTMHRSPGRAISSDAVASIFYCKMPASFESLKETDTAKFSPECLSDLHHIYVTVARNGRFWAATRFVEDVVLYCMNLVSFPVLGTFHGALRPNLYVGSYRRRVAIAYHIGLTRSITVDRILFGGQNLVPLFGDGEGE